MRKSNLVVILGALLCAGVVTSCSQNDEINEPENTAVRFTGTVSGAATATPQSRAAGTQWGANDEIGIFMFYDSNTALEYNKHYKVSNATTGEFTAVSQADQLFYPQDGSDVYFQAYYPYKSEMVNEGTKVEIEVATVQTTANQPAFDFLLGFGGAGNKNMNVPVEMEFFHKLSKLVINIVQPSSLAVNNTGLTDADLEGMTVTIKGMRTKAMFSFKTGFTDFNTVADITPRTIEGAKLYDVIIPPHFPYSGGVVTVDFTLASGETFTWDLGQEVFTSGNEYTYNVTLSYTGVEATGTISQWSPVDRGDVTAQ